MRKTILFLLLGVMLLTGCGKVGSAKETVSGADSQPKKKVTVTTSFLYDMVNQLAGDMVDKNL